LDAARVLFVTPEVYPLAKAGGLADVAFGLTKALRRAGCDARVLMPGYQAAIEGLAGPVQRAEVPNIPGYEHVFLLAGVIPGTDVPIWLIDCPPLYARASGPYQDGERRDWPDNGLRFGLLCRVATLIAQGGARTAWRPDVVHLNEWPAGPAAASLAACGPGHPPTVFTIHNMAFQGLFPPDVLGVLGLPEGFFKADGLEFWGKVSFLKAGIRYADQVTTVSEAYAKEILTPAFGCGLDGALKARPDGVIGIRNGVDEDDWNPATDHHLPATYRVHDLGGKAVCKAAVRTRFGLAPDATAPVMVYLCRLTEQKMADVVLAALPGLVARGARLVVMGQGDRAIEAAFHEATRAHSGRVGVLTDYDEPLAHLLVAGADMLLAPARFEPCGLTQMYGMRYGTVPVASRVGGLAETIVDLPPALPDVGGATGFLFDEPDAAGLIGAIERALACFRRPHVWRKLAANGMRADFSWARSARRYIELYRMLAPAPARRDLLLPLRRRVVRQRMDANSFPIAYRPVVLERDAREGAAAPGRGS
jgi:starch synthase